MQVFIWDIWRCPTGKKMIKLRKNKRGWIKIMEAFISILLIVAVALIIINKGYSGRRDLSPEVYALEISMIREIQLNNSLRKEILEIASLPANGTDIPANVTTKINALTPNYLTCEAKVCNLNSVCNLALPSATGNVYVKTGFIAGNLNIYAPRKINMFCWED